MNLSGTGSKLYRISVLPAGTMTSSLVLAPADYTCAPAAAAVRRHNVKRTSSRQHVDARGQHSLQQESKDFEHYQEWACQTPRA